MRFNTFAKLAEIEKTRPLTEQELAVYENSLKIYRDNVNVLETAGKIEHIKLFVDILSSVLSIDKNEAIEIIKESNGIQQAIQAKVKCSKMLITAALQNY